MENILKVTLAKICSKAICKSTALIDNQQIRNWIPIILCWQPNLYLGISEDGYWVVEERSGLRVLSSPREFIRIKVLLEQPMSNIRQEIETVLNTYNIELDNAFVFPFVDIIREVIEEGSAYWVELAFKWYDELSLKEKIALKPTLRNFMESKQATQKLRHKAKKELKLNSSL